MKNYKYKVDFPLNFEYAKNNTKFKEFLKENINKLDFSEGIRELLKLLMNYETKVVEFIKFGHTPSFNMKPFNINFNFD